MATQPDGGRNALAGFLYQIVGVLGLEASAHRTGEAGDETELEALVKLVQSGTLEHEALGQDAALRQILEGGEGLTLVQFKYSRKVPPRLIDKGEYDEVVRRLAEADERAEGLGSQVVGFILITNREIPSHSQDKDPSVKSRGSKSAPGPDKPKRGKGRKPRTPAVDPRQEKVRQRLRVIENIPQADWMARLRNFASEFGCKEPEVERGINNLVGVIMRQTVDEGDGVIEEATLIEAFTGYATTRRITREYLRVKSVEQVASILERLGHPGPPVRRKLLDDISDEIRNRALVIVEGPGGSGKSTALADWARRMLEAPAPEPGTLTSVWATSEIRPSWITEVVCDWSELPPIHHVRRNELPLVAIGRLAVANPSALQPILLLGLDGLDEGADFADRRKAVHEALDWFWREDEQAMHDGRPPDAALVVTCRRARDVEEQWLNRGASGFPSRRRPAIIPFGDFSSAELLEAVRRDLAPLYGRFYASVRGLGDASTGSLDDLIGGLPSSLGDELAVPIESEVIEMLCHPVMWRCLVDLTDDDRILFLDGEPEGIRAMARIFTAWFCRKARWRGVQLTQSENQRPPAEPVV